MTKTAFWLCLATVTLLSLLPTDYLPPPVFSVWDKAQHAFGFLVLAILGSIAYPQRAWYLPAMLLVYGGAIELAQAATGWRYGEWLDWLADGIGILAGSGVWHLLRSPLNHQA